MIGAELDEAHRGSASGELLRGVIESEPTAQAGLRSGDQRSLSEPADLVALVRKTAPGEVVPVTYKRGPSSHNTEVTLVADAE